MTLRIVFRGQKLGPQLRHGYRRAQERIRRTVTLTLQEAAAEITRRGRADIASGINASQRWLSGFHADTDIGPNQSRIVVSHDVPYWTIFQFGGTIKGKPLLWIPLPFAGDAKGVSARDFPGGLFRVDRKDGRSPLLFSIADRKPKYVGKESVTIPKKFHLLEIARDVARRMREFYSKHYRAQVR